MSGDKDNPKQFREPSETATNKPSDWDTRSGIMSEEEIRRLSAQKGKGELGASRADQSSKPGPNADEPSLEGGRAGERRIGSQEDEARRNSRQEEPPVPSDEWTKYDWS